MRLELHQVLPQEAECWSGSSEPTSLRVTRGFLKPLLPTQCQHSQYSSPSISPLWGPFCWRAASFPHPLFCPLLFFLPSLALPLSARLFVGMLIAAARAKIDSEITRRHCLFNFWLLYYWVVAVGAKPSDFHVEVNLEAFARWLHNRHRYCVKCEA